MVDRICETCSAPFQCLPYVVRNGQGKFCSRRCKGKAVSEITSARWRAQARERISDPVPLRGEMVCFIRMTKGAVTTIDAADAEVAARHCWSLDPHGYAAAKSRIDGIDKNVRLHRLLLPPPVGSEVDHINGDPLDNRRSNLRIVTRAENMQNITRCRKDSRTGVLGVVPNKKRTAYVARAKVNGKFFINKTFRTIAEAEAALKEARRKHQPFYAEAQEVRG